MESVVPASACAVHADRSLPASSDFGGESPLRKRRAGSPPSVLGACDNEGNGSRNMFSILTCVCWNISPHSHYLHNKYFVMSRFCLKTDSSRKSNSSDKIARLKQSKLCGKCPKYLQQLLALGFLVYTHP